MKSKSTVKLSNLTKMTKFFSFKILTYWRLTVPCKRFNLVFAAILHKNLLRGAVSVVNVHAKYAAFQQENIPNKLNFRIKRLTLVRFASSATENSSC